MKRTSSILRALLTILTLVLGGMAIPAGAGAATATAPGPVWASGSNSRGQLGSDTAGGTIPFPKTVPAPLNAGIVGLAAGTEYSLALAQSGALYAWGANGNGQLGTNAV